MLWAARLHNRLPQFYGHGCNHRSLDLKTEFSLYSQTTSVIGVLGVFIDMDLFVMRFFSPVASFYLVVISHKFVENDIKTHSFVTSRKWQKRQWKRKFHLFPYSPLECNEVPCSLNIVLPYGHNTSRQGMRDVLLGQTYWLFLSHF